VVQADRDKLGPGRALYLSHMMPETNVPLASFTSLDVGGPAERLYTCHDSHELEQALGVLGDGPLWVLGYGANALIADAGLPGTVLLTRGGSITRDENILIADAGVWWDDLVQHAIGAKLWGLELMSAIPGGVGAAIVGNIAAYGQAVADTLQWVEVWDRTSGQMRRMNTNELGLQYRYSSFQTPEFKDLVILRAAFGLSTEPTDVTYQSALDIATENGFDLTTLSGRRDTILETRARAGSLWDYRNPSEHMHTAGSFFRNPTVDEETAAHLMAYDETGKTAEMIQKMNQVHGGSSLRVSAAHVLLAAGFQRGQTWGPVRLHPDHILKIENTGGATAQQVYDVAHEIMHTVHDKLGIDLSPEVRFLGKFENNR
jgi:UDP-N-acetylmuramate dehydrogenase